MRALYHDAPRAPVAGESMAMGRAEDDEALLGDAELSDASPSSAAAMQTFCLARGKVGWRSGARRSGRGRTR